MAAAAAPASSFRCTNLRLTFVQFFFSAHILPFFLFRFFFLPYSFFWGVVVCTVIIVVITIIPFLLTCSSSTSGLRAFASGPTLLLSPPLSFLDFLRV